MPNRYDEACAYYDARYDLVFQSMFQVAERRELGDRKDHQCRFCGGGPPEVTFRKVAHAIPEALGNRGLTSAYECDACNGLFGRGIENELGEWSKPMRTFARLRGKNGVPTLRKGADGGWRIEATGRKLLVRSYKDDPLYEVDEENRRVTFTFTRGAYTPAAVFKSFVKIGLTLMPGEEMAPFARTLEWIRDTDHGRSWIGQAPLVHTFQNGPMPNDRMVALVLRRRPGITDVPYAFLVLGYGNDVFQVVLPVPAEDAHLNGRTLSLVPYPTPGGIDPTRYGLASPRTIDMTGRDVVRGEVTRLRMGYEAATRIDPSEINGLADED